MTRDELLRDLEASRREMLAALAGLPEDEAAQAGVMAGWSAKDLVAHITGWEAELLKAMAQGRQGKRPAYASLTAQDIDQRNEQWRKEFKKKPLAAVLTDYETVRQQTIRQVEKMTADEVSDTARYAWTDGRSLAAVIVGDTVEHDREHAAQIQQWRQGAKTDSVSA